MINSIKIKKQHLLFGFGWLAALCFLYFVILCDGISIRIPDLASKIAGYDNPGDNPYFSTLPYIIPKVVAQLIHQYPTLRLENVGADWIGASAIVTVSGVLWIALICMLFYANGCFLKKAQGSEHVDFSRVIASMALFQIVRSVGDGGYGIAGEPTPMGDRFLWVPLFVLVCIALGWRSYARIRTGKTSLRDELTLLAPFFAGLALIACSWLTVISAMRVGTSIEIPIIDKSINSYTVIFNLLMAVCCIALFQTQKKTLSNRNNEKCI